jgi:hypothetical protein
LIVLGASLALVPITHSAATLTVVGLVMDVGNGTSSELGWLGYWISRRGQPRG